jgi:hypothetical protein
VAVYYSSNQIVYQLLQRQSDWVLESTVVIGMCAGYESGNLIIPDITVAVRLSIRCCNGNHVEYQILQW